MAMEKAVPGRSVGPGKGCLLGRSWDLKSLESKSSSLTLEGSITEREGGRLVSELIFVSRGTGNLISLQLEKSQSHLETSLDTSDLVLGKRKKKQRIGDRKGEGSGLHAKGGGKCH